MRLRYLSILFVLGLAMAGCGSSSDDDNTCTTNVARCPDQDYYSCPAADLCYSNKTGCARSGECDK